MYDGSFSPHKKYFTPSRTPEIAIEVPTSPSSKARDISSPGTIAEVIKPLALHGVDDGLRDNL
jgi:hypothetical protein